MKLKLLSQQCTVFKSAAVILMILLLSTTNAFSQCAYANGTQVGSNYTLCVDNGNITTASVSTDQHVVINVVKGFNYTFSVGNVFFISDNYEKLTLFDGDTNAPLASASGINGTSINWTSSFSGTVKLQLNRGAANTCVSRTGSGTLTLALNSVGNTQDDPSIFGTDQWTGHVYNWTGNAPPGGTTSPTTVSTTNPFSGANYVGYYTTPEAIDTNFGGNTACFNVLSNGVNRVNIYTDKFAVRYRMRSTKVGYYSFNITADDGVRLYADGALVFNAWKEQDGFNFCNNLIYLDGDTDLVLDFYENGGENELKFSLTPFDISTNSIAGDSVRNVCSGSSPGTLDGSSFAACNASTYPNVIFQWQSSTDNVNFTDITGATAEDYTVPPVTTGTNNTRYFRRIVRQYASSASQPPLYSNVIQVNTSANSLGTTGSISGTGSLCLPASAQVYSIAAVNNALNYVWSVPAGWTITSGQGTRSITVIPGTSGQNGNISVIASNGCLTNAAQTLAVTVNPVPTSVTATASATTICEGQTINLSAASISNSPMDVTLIDENFNAATNSWTTANMSTGGTPANAAWTLRGNGYNYSGTVFSSNDSSQFYLSNSDAQGSGTTTNTTLQSPSFSTVGLTSATLSFYHYYRFNSGVSDRANVEVSTNGTTWTALTSYSSTQGARTNFALATVDLADYLGQATVYIRFRYAATYDYYWAIDNVSVKGVSNNAPATYSWTSNPPGFTSTLQNPTGVAPTVNTTYTVTVTNAAGCFVTASTPEVVVSRNTAITTQPAVTTTYCQNAAATALTVAATGNGTLSYQWYSNTTNSTSGGTLIGGATSAGYTPSTTLIGTRYYYAIVTGSCGTAISNTAAVTVNQNTAVTTQPAVTTTYCQNAAAAALTVSATGSALTYQWYSNVSNSTIGGTAISGATSSSYTPSTATVGTIYYYAVITGTCGTATSNIATLTVNSLPTATVVPNAVAPVCQNGTASFNLTGTPGATVTYNLNGGTSQTVVLDGSGDASVTVPSVIVNQTLNIVSVFDGTCTNPATSSATVVVGQHTVYNGSGWTITPTATNNLSAEIRAAYSSSGTSLNVCSLLVTNNAPVVISTGDSFTIRNGIQVDAGSSLTVSSDANLIQINDAAVNTGNITLKRDSKMKRLDYIYWGTPVEGQTLKTFSPNTVNNRFYNYNEIDDTFSVITPLTNPMVKGNGYVIRAPNNFTTVLQNWTGTFTGKPNNGTVDVAVTKLVAGKNLVGNPYPSNINLDQLTIDNPSTANGVYYFWTNINNWVINNEPTPNGLSGNYEDNNYAIYNATGGVPSAGSSLKPSGIVKPGQGFLYEARAGGTLRFTNNVRTNEVTDRWGTGSVFISNKTAGKTSPSAERYWLKLTNPAGQFNTLLMAYIEGATNSFEPHFDAKFPVESSDQFYSLSDGKNLIIQGRGYPFTSDDVVPLGMKGFEAGTYTMSLEDREGIFTNGQNIYLKDKQTGIITNLSQGSYAFAASAGVSNGRFEIIYEPQTVLAADGSVKENIQVYRDGSDFIIKSPGKKITTIEVYDTSGKLTAKSGANQTEVRMDGSNWVNGVYVIKINRNGEVITRKIVR